MNHKKGTQYLLLTDEKFVFYQIIILASHFQGTIIGLTNDSGAWVEKYAYTLYGKTAAASTVGNPYMYTGRRPDAETGLYYYRARYNDPHLRRFIETDPIGYAGGMNLYAYVGNSTVNAIDPLGLSAMEIALPIAAVLSQLDSPVPGPMDIVAGGTIGIALLIDHFPDEPPTCNKKTETGSPSEN